MTESDRTPSLSASQSRRIDAHASFVMGVLGLTAIFLVVIARIGVPTRVIVWLGPLLALAGICGVGAAQGTMKISRFFACGRSLPVYYGGAISASLALALALPALARPTHLDGLINWVLGLLAGVVLASLTSGPLLRKSGAFSLAEWLSFRFENLLALVLFVMLQSLICALLALAAFALAIDLLQNWLVLPPVITCGALAFCLIVLCVPGGMSGALWALATSFALLASALVWRWIVYGLGNGLWPLPAGRDAALFFANLDRWRMLAHVDLSLDGALIAMIAIGFAALTCCLSLFVSLPRARSAPLCGLGSLVWIGVIGVFGLFSLGVFASSLPAATQDVRPEQISETVYQASQSGLLSFCGQAVETPGQLRQACGQKPDVALPQKDRVSVAAFADLILGDLAPASSMALASMGLGGWLAICIGFCALNVQALAQSLGHDLFRQGRNHIALSSRRLALIRLMSVAAIAALALFVPQQVPFLASGMLFAFALALAGAVFAPLLLLSVIPRAGLVQIALGLLAGIAAIGGTAPDWLAAEQDLRHLPLAALTIASSILIVGALACLLPQRFAYSVFSGLRQKGAYMPPDKGA